MTIEALKKMLAQFDNVDDCWEINTPRPYPSMWFQGSTWNAMRVIYYVFVSSLIEGLLIDHLCKNKKCINPTHLEAVTLKENTRRHYRCASL